MHEFFQRLWQGSYVIDLFISPNGEILTPETPSEERNEGSEPTYSARGKKGQGFAKASSFAARI